MTTTIDIFALVSQLRARRWRWDRIAAHLADIGVRVGDGETWHLGELRRWHQERTREQDRAAARRAAVHKALVTGRAAS